MELVHASGPAPDDEGLSPADTALPPDHPSLPADHASTPADLAPPDRRRRWFTRPPAVLAAVLVVVAVVANLAEAARDEARRAAVAEMPRVLEPMSRPPVERWRLPGYLMGGTTDVLLVADGDTTLAVDPSTGDVLWSRVTAVPGGPPGYCSSVGPGALLLEAMYMNETLDPALIDAPALLACSSGSPFMSGEGPVEFGPVVVDVVDVRTGEVRHALTTTGALLSSQAYEDEVLVLVATPQGHLRVVRWDPVSGAQLSDATSEHPVVAPGTASVSNFWQQEGVLVVTGENQAAFSLETGREVPLEDAPDGIGWDLVTSLPDGAEVRWTFSGASGHGEVVDADGTVRFEVEGQPWWTETSDGSAPEVLLTLNAQGDEAVALDVRTGEELWRTMAAGGQVMVRMDGVLVIDIGPTVKAVDARDGTELWTSESDDRYPDGLTDGEVVVLTERDEGVTELVARDLRDGTERWRGPAPDGLVSLHAWPGGHLVGSTSDGVLGLR